MKKLLILVLLFSCFACSQEEDFSNRTFLLSGDTFKSWQIVSIKQDGKDGIPLSCQADDVETFYANTNYSYGHGNKSCSNQSNLDGTWQLSGDFKSVTINYSDENIFATTYQIISLKAEELVLEQKSFYHTIYTYQLVK